MLKVIAQDFIKPEAIEIVLPLYREMVEKTRQKELRIAYDLFVDKRIHQDKCRVLPPMSFDEWDQPREMLGPAMRVQSGPVRPFFDENKISGIFR
nr:hypothetical protein [Rhizobium sp. WYJ-E13]